MFRRSFTSAAVAALLTAGVTAAQPQVPTTPAPQPPVPQQTTGPVTQPVAPQLLMSGSGIQLVPPSAPPRATFTFSPGTLPESLLPTPPKAGTAFGPLLTDDLRKVPEAEFELETAGVHPTEAARQAAHQLAKINHLNAGKTDAFMKALIEHRGDLAGLPFAMGDDCRTDPDRAKHFQIAVNHVRTAMGGGGITNFGRGGGRSGFGGPNGFSGAQIPGGGGQAGGMPMQQPTGSALIVQTPATFWTTFAAACQHEDANRPTTDKKGGEHATVARIAALMQMLAPEALDLRIGLVKFLAGVSHAEATAALAKLAVFSAEDEVRAAATDALKVRRDRDYTAVLVAGLRYPFPAVAKRTAEVIVKTGRKDLIPELVKVLDEADPRSPREIGGKAVVREMVRINHHRNCMMCHAPGTSAGIQPTVFTAEVPVQGKPLQSMAQGYNQAVPNPDLMVRLDVTYLRQDFSVMLPVTDAAPWPEMQRYDFLVRERALSSHELISFKDALAAKEDSVVTPYHKAALAALRDLTGKDAAPTAEAWRKVLKL